MSEKYYAEMEAARNESEDRYFAVRPEYDSEQSRAIFRAAFERAFLPCWNEKQAFIQSIGDAARSLNAVIAAASN